ncbi:hypothetical protein WQ54_23410 [Bacillus sp. SA1-12]|uniref:hypothetical protein n=1 Tax=Bacillus sp. SA1-12 TaxID=1455638 RepID=UPI00062723C6|nr:hypothetical protein [Bacillus sp. SA1-12]KKI90066.1 hypothetical protein WQ54_23410 [Bacillus sp. SA1-12]
MWNMIGIAFIGVLITLFEIPPLIKKKWWREMIVYFLLLTAGLTLCMLISVNVGIPTPMDFITNFYNPVSSYIERILS